MPTAESPRRFAAVRACAALLASGLVLGLAAPPAGAAPTRSGETPSDVSPTTSTAAETLDPTFIQEGMPTPHGGQVVAWGDPSYNRHLPRALPDGVKAVGISVSGTTLLVLRSDGLVDWYDQSSHGRTLVPTPPAGMTYTGVAALYGGGHVLRSDGIVMTIDGEVVMRPPEGLRYIAISRHMALRSDGVVAGYNEANPGCTAARQPGAGLRYTALSAQPGSAGWAALRSDGALVSCNESRGASVATVVPPPAGTSFVGVDVAENTVLAATADGRVFGEDGVERAAAPTGRSIVSLTNVTRSGTQAGSAVLDDGSLLHWGDGAGNLFQPVVPEGRDIYSAVSASYSDTRWAIMVGDPIHVEVSVVPYLAADRVPRVTESVLFRVTASLGDGRTVPGWVDITGGGPNGEMVSVGWGDDTRSGPAELVFGQEQHSRVGSYEMESVFSGSPYATTSVTMPIEFREPSPVVVTPSSETSWRQGSERTLCLEVAPQDQASSLWRYGRVGLSVEGIAEWTPNATGGTGACLSELDLPPGTHTVRFDYKGWGAIDSVSWSGEVVVLPAFVTHIESDLPSSWRYGNMPDVVWADVTADGPLQPYGMPGVDLEVNETPFNLDGTVDEAGRSRLWLGNKELLPGTYQMAAVFTGGNGFSPSRQEQTVTVKPGIFATSAPTITGTAKVGLTLTAVPAHWAQDTSYLWKVDGVVPAYGRLRTLEVSPSMAGKKITVTITQRRDYYEPTVLTSAPTAAVIPAMFTAPQPTITGTVKVGKTVTVSPGSWSPTPSSAEYVWKADGVRIATPTPYKLVIPSSVRGKTLTVTIVGYREGYATKYVTSAPTAPVAAGTFTAPRPTITGTVKVGKTLTVSRGSWSPSPSSVKYVWKANGVRIATRTTNKLVVPSSVRGKTLTVTIVGYRSGYTTKYTTSYRTATIR